MQKTYQCWLCRADGCIRDGRCKMGFPHRQQSGAIPELAARDAQGTKFHYHAPRPVDVDTVAHHPPTLAAWGAHCNIAKVTNSNWSSYVLKYSVKPECIGTLNLDDDNNAAVFGLDNISAVRRRAFAAHTMSRPITAAEAVLSLNDVQPVLMPKVLHINSQPPNTRYTPKNTLCFTYLAHSMTVVMLTCIPES